MASAALIIPDKLMGGFAKKGRYIIVYTKVDTRLLFVDMESRFRLAIQK